MSLELLPTLEKDVIAKKKSSSENITEPKKEGSSLFDSLLKDAVKEKADSKTTQGQTQHKTGDKTTDSTSVVKTAKESTKLEDNETPVKKMVNSLVEIVVDKSKEELKAIKSTKTKTAQTEATQNIKTEKVTENETTPIKQKIEQSVKTIKETAKILSQDIQTDKSVENNTVSKNEAKISENKVEPQVKELKEKITIIKDATNNIKEEIQKVVQEEKVTKKSPKEVNNETENVKTTSEKELPKVKTQKETSKENTLVKKVENKIETINQVASEIEDVLTSEETTKKDEVKKQKTLNSEQVSQKATIITNAAQEIQNEVGKVVFVSSGELVKRIQEFKNETKGTESTLKIAVVGSKDIVGDSEVTEKSSVLSNSFLTAQKQEKQRVSMQNIQDAKTNIEEKKTVVAVKQSANTLELNPEDIEVEQVGEKGESKSELFSKNNKQIQEQFYQNKSLNKMVIEGQTKTNAVHQEIQQKVVEQKIVEEENNTTKQKETTVSMNVPQNVVETIQSRIIGAHQRVGSFMSEVARNMYLNYKPPFTSFRMNLNPANLGSISIVMRANNSDSNISVSMNMSSSATLDSFVDNKAALQNALQRQLGENSNITLDFGMQDGNNADSFSSNMNQSGSNGGSQESNQETNEGIVNSSIEQEDSKALDYM